MLRLNESPVAAVPLTVFIMYIQMWFYMQVLSAKEWLFIDVFHVLTYLQLSDVVQVSIAFMCLVWVGITYPYRAFEFTPGFYWGSCHSSFSFTCMFCRLLFLCVVCSSLIYGFWLLLWYLLKVQPSMCECTNPGPGVWMYQSGTWMANVICRGLSFSWYRWNCST